MKNEKTKKRAQQTPRENAGDRLLLTVTAAAARLGVSRTTLYELLRSGAVKYRRLPGGDPRIPARELEAFAHADLIGVVEAKPAKAAART